MELSIIIPTLDEEKNLPRLLKEIREQTSAYNCEVIIADANSKDRTVDIARQFNCKIVKGGLPGKGRNEGAKNARYDLFFFLDADITIPDDFFKRALKEFQRRKLDSASFRLVPQNCSILVKLGFDIFYNWPITIMQKFIAYGAMGILVKKRMFYEVGGFDEEIKLGEDVWFLRQAKMKGRFGIIKSVNITPSLRRFRRDGYLRTAIKHLLSDWHMLLLGPIKSDILHYKFGPYDKK